MLLTFHQTSTCYNLPSKEKVIPEGANLLVSVRAKFRGKIYTVLAVKATLNNTGNPQEVEEAF